MWLLFLRKAIRRKICKFSTSYEFEILLHFASPLQNNVRAIIGYHIYHFLIPHRAFEISLEILKLYTAYFTNFFLRLLIFEWYLGRRLHYNNVFYVFLKITEWFFIHYFSRIYFHRFSYFGENLLRDYMIRSKFLIYKKYKYEYWVNFRDCNRWNQNKYVDNGMKRFVILWWSCRDQMWFGGYWPSLLSFHVCYI